MNKEIETDLPMSVMYNLLATCWFYIKNVLNLHLII